MIVSCKNCGAKFKVSKGDIGPGGRNVRCSACEYEWFQENIQASTVEEEMAAKSHTRIIALKDKSIPLHRNMWLSFLLNTTSLLAFVLLLFVLALTYRGKIIEHFPEAAQLFEAIHLHDVSDLRFTFADFKLNAAPGDTQSSENIGLNIKVVAKNIGEKAQYLEVIKFSVYTKDKEFIGEHTMHLDKVIEAGNEEVIEGRLSSLPKTVTFVIVEMGNLFDIALRNQSEILSYKSTEDHDEGREILPTEAIL